MVTDLSNRHWLLSLQLPWSVNSLILGWCFHIVEKKEEAFLCFEPFGKAYLLQVCSCINEQFYLFKLQSTIIFILLLGAYLNVINDIQVRGRAQTSRIFSQFAGNHFLCGGWASCWTLLCCQRILQFLIFKMSSNVSWINAPHFWLINYLFRGDRVKWVRAGKHQVCFL